MTIPTSATPAAAVSSAAPFPASLFFRPLPGSNAWASRSGLLPCETNPTTGALSRLREPFHAAAAYIVGATGKNADRLRVCEACARHWHRLKRIEKLSFRPPTGHREGLGNEENDLDSLLDTQRAAAYLGISAGRLHKKRAQKTGPKCEVTDFGYRYRLRDLEAYVKERKRGRPAIERSSDADEPRVEIEIVPSGEPGGPRENIG